MEPQKRLEVISDCFVALKKKDISSECGCLQTVSTGSGGRSLPTSRPKPNKSLLFFSLLLHLLMENRIQNDDIGSCSSSPFLSQSRSSASSFSEGNGL